MGKKARKTRWRTLTLADEFSDSEASSTTTPPVFKSQKYSSNRYTYSSQSRKYQYDGSKSTRSSSTTSENKMAFNEDDYTKISTPRQDVLFKKGYLNKPKNFSTQTSTGASTNSTGNSTGNGTPDYQSTDLEYESQFVFPNGFVDHNGCYYVNGYDYPFMFYNVPTYYPECSNYRSKRYSSGSLTESTSPNNEEVTSQDLSSAEASNSHSDYSGHYPIQNHVTSHNPNCPNYYQNGNCSSNGIVNGESPIDQSRKIKKLRRRRTASQLEDQDSSENSDVEINNEEQKIITPHSTDSNETVHEKLIVKSQENDKESGDNCEDVEARLHKETVETHEDHSSNEQSQLSNEENESTSDFKDLESSQDPADNLKCTTHPEISKYPDTSNHKENVDPLKSQVLSPSIILHESNSNHTQILDPTEPTNNHEIPKLALPSHTEDNLDSQLSNKLTNSLRSANKSTDISEGNTESDTVPQLQEQQPIVSKYDLKPDAEEFIPRAYRTQDISISPVQFINISGNFMPIPVFPFNGQTFNPAFIPPGIPLNFIPPDPKMFPNYVGLPPSGQIYNGHGDVYNEEHHLSEKSNLSDNNFDTTTTANDQKSESESVDKNKLCSKAIDIATVFSKLEVAAKEQEEKEHNAVNKNMSEQNNDIGSKKPRIHPRFRNTVNFDGNYKNRSQNSPQREIRYRNKDLRHKNSPVSNGGTNTPNVKEIATSQKVGLNHIFPSTFKPNPSVNQPNSPPKQNSENSANSSQAYSHKQLQPTASNSHSPLRKNIEYYKTSPYKQNGSKASTTKPTLLITKGTREIKSDSCISPTKINSNFTSGKTPDKNKKNLKQTNETNNKWKQFDQKTDHRTRSVENKVRENGVIHENNIQNSSLNGKDSSEINQDITEEITKTEPTKFSSLPQENLNNSPRSPNQWISVQKRKKRKNKNVEEVDNFTDEETDDQQHNEFESYDVNQLTDVVIHPEKANENRVTNDENTEENKNENEKVEILSLVTEAKLPIVEKDSKELSDIINSVDLPQVDIVIQSSIQEVQREDKHLNEVRHSTLIKEESENIMIKDKKRKLKKNAQPLPKKKVIIKDLDLSEQYTEIKEPVKMIVTKVEKNTILSPSSTSISNPTLVSQDNVAKHQNDSLHSESNSEIIETFEKEASTESITSSEQDEKKKSKKRRKKASKLNSTNTSSNSDSILGAMEDTFDFLNSALTGETEDKTNDEISEELDKIIQKGMLNSIEEKIKSLNIDESDGFFKSVWTKLSRKETSMGYTKIPDFTEILKPSSKTQLVSEDINFQNKESSDILHPGSVEPTIQDGLFLEYPDLVEVLEDDEKSTIPPETVDADEEDIKLSKYELESVEIEQPDILYPITKAVKEWMCRTRETTPDIELLKSPRRLYQEFGDISDSDPDTEVCNSVETFSKELTPSSEITLFASDRKQSVEQDFMDFWEDDVKVKEKVINNESNLKEIVTNDDDGDEIPVYESQYGKNEDFLNIQRKVHQQKETYGGSSQSHTSLPPRAAVCCNIM